MTVNEMNALQLFGNLTGQIREERQRRNIAENNANLKACENEHLVQQVQQHSQKIREQKRFSQECEGFKGV